MTETNPVSSADSPDVGKHNSGGGGGGRGPRPGWENWVGSHRGVVDDGWMTTLFSLASSSFPRAASGSVTDRR